MTSFRLLLEEHFGVPFSERELVAGPFVAALVILGLIAGMALIAAVTP